MIGVLLINLGTPIAATKVAVKEYLIEFLMDEKVIALPFVLRWILVKLLIVPLRLGKSTRAYKSIWTAKGSPLLCNSRQLAVLLQEQLTDNYQVVLAMRYGNPGIGNAIKELADCHKVIVLPLFPQYAEATTGSAIAAVQNIVANDPKYIFINNFFNNQQFIAAWAANIKKSLSEFSYDYLLFSYHGLPQKIGKTYQQQCFETTKLIAYNLQLDSNKYSSAFQSRLGFASWLTPYTDKELIRLYNIGVRNLAICCPSFVVDCLETLEEIGIRLKDKWLQLGGQSFKLIPCLNASQQFITDLIP